MVPPTNVAMCNGSVTHCAMRMSKGGSDDYLIVVLMMHHPSNTDLSFTEL